MATVTTTAADYDAMPYPGSVYPLLHPSRVGAVGLLYGFSPARCEGARVLEMACANGENLIPMAVAMPGASFVGVDFSPRQVENARALAARLGLTNIRFECLDVRAFPEDGGAFDYIIAHGLYSWVDAGVRDKVLGICKRHLGANGMAAVSYNVLPGWYMRLAVREMMLFHAGVFPGTGAAEARQFVEFLAEATCHPQQPYAVALRDTAAAIRKDDPGYLRHDFMESVNEPVSFTDFAGHVGRHGLQVLGDSEFGFFLPGSSAQATQEALARFARGDYVCWEQCVDFVTGRQFRQSLLVHAQHTVSRMPVLAGIQRLRLASSAKCGSEVKLPAAQRVQFRDEQGLTSEAGHAAAQMALAYLGEVWPQRVTFQDLRGVVGKRLAPAGVSADELARELLPFIWSGLVEIHHFAPLLARGVSERPVASPLVRMQASGAKNAASLQHYGVALQSFERAALPLLDGSRDQEALVAELTAALDGGRIKRGELVAADDGRSSVEIVRAALPGFLRWAARRALLVG